MGELISLSLFRFYLCPFPPETPDSQASHAAEKGFSDAQIRTLGRWKSDAFKLYIRSDTLHAN